MKIYFEDPSIENHRNGACHLQKAWKKHFGVMGQLRLNGGSILKNDRKLHSANFIPFPNVPLEVVNALFSIFER